MVNRLDVALDVGPTTDQIALAYDGGDPVTLSLTHGTYWTLAELCDHIQDLAVADVDASVVVQETNGVVAFSAGGTDLAITWPRPSLQWWLGYDGVTTTAAASHSGATSPAVWRAQMVWDDARPLGWEWSVRHGDGPRGQGRIVAIGQLTRMSTYARVSVHELAQARSVMALLLRGLPATWWRDTGNVFAFSTTNWRGFVRVRLAPDQRAYADQWRRQAPRQILELPLELIVEA